MKILYALLALQVLASCSPAAQNDRECVSFEGWREKTDKIPHLHPSIKVFIDHDKVKLDNDIITTNDLTDKLNEFEKLEPRPFFILTFKNSNCEVIVKVKNIMEKELQCSQGMCGFGEGWER